jgi:hypothetical protein
MFFRKKEKKKDNFEDYSDIEYKPGLMFVELIFEETPNFQIEKILDEMRTAIGNIELMMNSKDITAFVFKDYPVKFRGGEMPSQCILFSTVNKIDYEKLIPSLQQTRDWNGVDEVIRKCKYKIAFSDFMANHNDAHTRLRLFNEALKIVIKNVNCKALHFLHSQLLVDPNDFINRIDEGDQLAGVFNLRFFNVQNTEDMLMDTLGLSIFGLPDIQCHFKAVDPNEIARVVYNAGYYIFDKGDIINDGETIGGIKQDDKWRCQHEESLAEPKRIVIDINPGSPYAAGGR